MSPVSSDPPTDRLYGMMQALMAERVGNPPPWQEASPEPRDIVTEDDACDAVIHVAAVIDQALQDGVLDQERLAFAGAMLMVIRDNIRPLPKAASDSGTDAVGDDVRAMVDAIRKAKNL